MTTPNVRRNGSGPLVRPQLSLGLLDWNAAAPAPFTLAPAGHKPGLYRIILSVYVVTGGVSGAVDALLAWSQPRVGVTSVNVTNVAAIAITGYSGISFRALASTGESPIVVTYSGVSAVGSPVIQLASATFIESSFPAGRS